MVPVTYIYTGDSEMVAIFEHVARIASAAVIAMLVRLMLPDGKLKTDAERTVGLVTMLTIVEPLIKFITQG